MLTKYRCNRTECGAEDSDRTTSPPYALICWKCGNGRETKNPGQQMEAREGMFPVNADGNFPWEV